jgi:hypothetical protein
MSNHRNSRIMISSNGEELLNPGITNMILKMMKQIQCVPVLYSVCSESLVFSHLLGINLSMIKGHI